MRRLAAVLAVFLMVGTVGSVKATTTDDAEHILLGWINEARADQGLANLRSSGMLWDLANIRARRMASTNVLTHSVAGSIGSQLNARGLTWYMYGEDIGYSPKTGVLAAATELFALWKASPSHWTLMMSARFNYVGVGMGYRASNGRWYSSIIFTESPDMTGAGAAMVSADRSGQDVRWSWRGWDPLLQTHTAGMSRYEVQSRIDGGTWRTVVHSTTSTTRLKRDLAGGHWYSVRVRARDRRGNVGAWTSETRVWVP